MSKTCFDVTSYVLHRCFFFFYFFQNYEPALHINFLSMTPMTVCPFKLFILFVCSLVCRKLPVDLAIPDQHRV